MNKEELEEYALYESGLVADGCLEKLDEYAKKAIERYGRYLVKSLEEDNNFLKEQLQDYKEEEDNVLKLKTELMKLRTEHETLKKITKSLYGTVLHVFVLAKEEPLVLIGPELYKEAAKGVKDYEDYEKN